jgi:hypothetical protein
VTRRHWPFVVAATSPREPSHDELGRALERDTAVQGEAEDDAERAPPPPAPRPETP